MTVHFAVRDSGIGMSEDVQNQLFQSFFQADASTTRRFGGTDLDAIVARSYVWRPHCSSKEGS